MISFSRRRSLGRFFLFSLSIYDDWMRRRRTNGESVPPLHKCKFSILSIVANAAKAYGKKHSNTEARWVRPQNRQIKLNVDASFHNDSEMGAVGAVLRDFQGQFVAASAKVLTNVESVLMAEAHAMKDGLALAATIGCNNIIAESDSTDVIQACNGADCVDMAVSIGSVTFSHVLRDANQVAHTLARESFFT
jgi:hypothetical protein